MTLESTNSWIIHDPNGIQTSFIYDFRVDELSHMVVYADGVLYLEPFTMTGLGEALGGTVDFTTAPDVGIVNLQLVRILPLIQGAPYPPYDPFPAESHELVVDELTMMLQQQQEELDRCVKVPPGYDPGDVLPPPAPGYTLVWNETGTGFDNAPGEESFLSWVDRSEAAAESATASEVVCTWAEEYAYLWAVEEEDVLVNDGIHTPNYSAYHWASKSSEGGILDIASEDTQMMVVNTPDARYRSLEMIHGTPGGMVKLDNGGLVPLENLPFSGNMVMIGPIEGHDRCPKYSYTIPDETPCVDPDYRNPSERWPSIVWRTGDYFIIVGCDEAPLLNQMNLINPDTGVNEVQTVDNNFGLLYLDGTGAIPDAGWYLYEGAGGGGVVLAEDVLFDDSGTDIKGINVQLWNQNADAVIQGKVDRAGDLMTGDLVFMNGIGVRSYLSDGITDANLIEMSDNNDLLIGGAIGQDGDVRIYHSNDIAIGITDSSIDFYRGIRVPNLDALWSETVAGGSYIPLIWASSTNDIMIGSDAASPSTNLYASDTIALSLTTPQALFSGHLIIPNSSALLSNLAGGGTGSQPMLYINSSDQLVLGGVAVPVMQLTGQQIELWAGDPIFNVLAIDPAYNLTAGVNAFNIAADGQIDIKTTGAGQMNLGTANGTGDTYLESGGDFLVFDTQGNIDFRVKGVGVALAGEQSFRFLNGSSHGYTVRGGLSGAVTIDLANHTHQEFDVVGTTTITFTSPELVAHCTMRIFQPIGIDINWPADIFWAGGSAPSTPASVPEQYRVVSLYKDTGWWGSWSTFAQA